MRKSLFILPVLILLASCSSGIKITSDYNKSVEFDRYKTYSYYGWSEYGDKLVSEEEQQLIEQSFADEFNRRGLNYIKSGGDIIVSLYIVFNKESSTSAYVSHYNYGPYRYNYNTSWGWGMGYGNTRYHENDYTVGTLICDVLDNSSKDLIWQGVGSGAINENPDVRKKNIPRAVSKIMRYYPVSPVNN